MVAVISIRDGKLTGWAIAATREDLIRRLLCFCASDEMKELAKVAEKWNGKTELVYGCHTFVYDIA